MTISSFARTRPARGLALLATVALGVPLVCAGSANAGPTDSFTARLDYQFRDHQVPVGDRLADLIAQLTLEEKVALASGSSAAAIERLGLNAGRSVAGGEGLHGIQGGDATVFPSSLALSQSWDPALLSDVGDVIAEEGLAMAENPWWMFFGGEQWAPGAPGRLAPVLDLLRDPRYGRAYETYGEDAYLTGALGTAITGAMNDRTPDGYQKFVPALKHPLAYGTEINRLWTNTVMPERSKNEYYVKAFQYPIAAGNAKSLMNSYPLVNGKPMSVNPLQDALLNEWTPDYEGTGHYEYTTMNDYGSGSSMWVHSQRYFSDTPEGRSLGVAEGVLNGQMSWSLRDYGSYTSSTDMLYEALARGMITEADVEENAKRALAMALRLGDYDHLALQNPYMAMGSVARGDLLPDNRQSAFDASAEQIVLLKNDGVLPLSGSATDEAVLLGSLGEDILKDHYTGNFVYGVTIKDALENKLGAGNVHYDRAVDTVSFQADNGNYLLASNNAYSDPGSSSAGGGYPPAPADVPITATGTPSGTDPSTADTPLLFELYDFGELSQLLRTPINDRFVQVPHTQSSPINAGLMVNNTSQPGQASLTAGNTAYVNYQTFRVVGTDDGKVGIYNQIAGNGGNNSYGESAMAYDQDDEDLNNGSYLFLDASGAIKADTTDGHVGPFRNENHTVGASVTEAPFDTGGNDRVVDGLPDTYEFDMRTVESNTDAIAAKVGAADPGAPIIMVVGYDPHLNAREAIDLQQTGLSAQQTENIDYVTNTLGRDVILVVKTGSPMTIDAAVQSNPRIKAILEIGHSGQEEGSALIAALFDDGYSVPATGWAPAASKYSPYGNYTSYPGYLAAASTRTIPAFSPAGRLSATWYRQVEDMVGASEDNPPASYRWPAYAEADNDNLSNLNGTVPKGLMTYDIIKGERTYQYFNGTPLYEFGYGLTYTDFDYTATVSPIANGKFTVAGTVRNTGTKT
ncbi:MAG: glycoside hydrolase family 3 C-terminal domain-containing protein, partial [Bifidobacteriaceae bacterium]|nr:glycoside hydrolase family 3 C-terminal domain-containing protein [Bifidobacteriaceae bacterium]